ncbi:MAG TPA: hypothetical protein VEI28_03155 [Thermodesulfovibrionales bacterium]|nr:hypothetical protein [Thermodesulfovibrionales bacterium]
MPESPESQKFTMRIVIVLLMFIGLESELFSISLQQGILSNSPSPLKIPTYDGSGQITHPDVISFEFPWNNYIHWMVATPYPDRNAAHENPSIFASNDGKNWSVPAGISNPIARPPANAYLSDPDIVYHPSYGIRVYYRLVDESNNRIFFIQSSDGRKWTQPVETIAVPNHQLISPAVIVRENQYIMYSVKLSGNNNTRVERRRSKDGIKWRLPEDVTVLNVKDDIIWHIDASYVPIRKEFWLLFYSYPSSFLYLAVSKDGLRFNTLPVPLLAGSEEPKAWKQGVFWDSGLYRSTFQVSRKGEFLLWYTGTKAPADSHIGFVKADLRKILPYIP